MYVILHEKKNFYHGMNTIKSAKFRCNYSKPIFSHPLNFYLKALHLHSPFSKNDPSYKDSSSSTAPPPPHIIPFALYQTYPSNASSLRASFKFLRKLKEFPKIILKEVVLLGRRARAKWRRMEQNQQTPLRLRCSFARSLHKTASYLTFNAHTYPASSFF